MKHVLTTILLIFLGCSKNDNNLVDSSALKGQWIETESRLDTLSFESSENFEIMNLNRGKEMKDGYLLPKSGSGPYYYNLSEEKISLKWMLSSDGSSNDYYFKVNGDKFNIGNFYDSLNGETLTFEKLK